MSTVLILMTIFGAGLCLSAVSLWSGARLVKAPKASLIRAAAGSVLLGVFPLFVGVVFGLVNSFISPAKADDAFVSQLAFEGCSYFCTVCLSWIAIRLLFGTTLARSVAIWAFSLLAAIFMLAFVFGIIKPFVVEAFIVPTNSMAPTVRGWHTETECPRCGGLLISPDLPPSERAGAIFDQTGICASCFKTSVAARAGLTHAPDRIMVNKLLVPQRWDIVVVRDPTHPATKYPRRLVGLPGETVSIAGGAVVINGTQVDLPAELKGLDFSAVLQEGLPIEIGTAQSPTTLAKGEYFVVGDFSRNALDSRTWGPVSSANVDGVVTLCYFPASRLRAFR
jgi:signal peptidase I